MVRIRLLITPMILCALSLWSSVADADSNVSIGVYVDVPPLIYQAPPPMVWYPALGVYIAMDSPYRLFFYGGNYYYFRDGQWYVGLAYGGPWARIDRHRLPSHLRRFRDRDWQRYQHDAERYDHRGHNQEHPSFPAWREKRGDDGRGHERGHDHDHDHDHDRDHDRRQ